MPAFVYKIETIENFDDDAATEAALNAEGTDGWQMTTIDFKPNESTGKSTATILYRGSSSSFSSSSSSSVSFSSTSSSSSITPLNGLWSIRIDGEEGNVSWNGDAYVFTGNASLDVICCWAEGFRPDIIRIYFTGDPQIKLEVWDTESNSLNNITGYTSGFPMSLTFAGNDIGRMKLLDVGSPLFLTEVTFESTP